ncbi:hypothetical protein [Flavobacterium sp. 7A]|uniref:hypothetical protein n=1 Tax=Flavobacterium sp. 7A TaxID=2940571 RepID=UPI0022260896|nr:hypothetical protein [Flavobacterium sp. 7A]MCW2119888.1 hypothetical protein [Flavobacterium sp. 7A]
MKKAIILSALAMVMSFGTLSAKELRPKKNHSAIKHEISNLLTPSNDIANMEEDVSVKVSVLITPINEIVVLKTNSATPELDEYIKESLNYKKLSSSDIKPGHKYEFEVNFRS